MTRRCRSVGERYPHWSAVALHRTREIYVHYGAGMGQSRLVVPVASRGTGRDLNTERKLVEVASELAG